MVSPEPQKNMNMDTEMLDADVKQSGDLKPGSNPGVRKEEPSSFYDPRPDLPTATNYKLVASFSEHEECVSSIKFQRDGMQAASASGDKTAKCWDIEAGKCVHTFRGHSDGLNDVTWNWDGNVLATASNDLSVRLWDCNSGQCVRKLQGHTSYVMSCAFSATGDVLATAGFDETIRLWCMHTGKQIRAIPAHSDPILSIDFSADLAKPILASASNDGICRLWMTHSGECGRSLVPDPSENPCVPVSFCKFTPNNKYLLLGTLTSRLQLWDYEPKPGSLEGMAPYAVKKTYKGHINTRYALQATFLVNEPTGNKYVVSGSEDHHIFIWDLNKRKVSGIIRGKPSADAPGDGHCDVVHSVDANAQSPIIGSAGGSRDRTVKFWKYSNA